MSWKKHFKAHRDLSPINGGSPNTPAYRNYQSQLPEVYVGHPNRIERYNQYEQMDADSEVNAALDIIAEFCTQTNVENGTAFDIFFKDDPTDNEIKIIKQQLREWCSLNEFDKRIFKIFRNSIKYGDQVFIRDPETFKLLWVEMNKVTKIIVDECAGKEPEQYIVKDIAPNLMNLTATALPSTDTFIHYPQTGGANGAYTPNAGMGGSQGGTRFQRAMNENVINAEHILHLSLTEGLDVYWPFGTSILETVFKVFKQKELLEDAIIIYRIQRAPERRIFKIDVGNMPAHMAMAFVERVKNEVHQRRIPTTAGGGANMMDATYNPLSINEDFFFPQSADGRGSTVDVFPGGQNLGEITDLRFFTNKLFRGLRIPSSYLPTQLEEGSNNWNDGKVGTAVIQEWRFTQYCKRLQALISDSLDHEFKMFMRYRGFNIDSSLFDLRFNEPQNFTKYRQAEIDGAHINSFTSLEGFAYLSKRFLLERYLGLSEEEIQRNEELWAEENKEPDAVEGGAANLRNVGLTPGGISSDLDNIGGMEADIEGGEGADMAATDAGGMPGGDAGGAPGGDAGGGPSPIGGAPAI